MVAAVTFPLSITPLKNQPDTTPSKKNPMENKI